MPSSGVPARSTLPGTAGVFGHLLGSEKVNSSLKLHKRTGWVSLTHRSAQLNSTLIPMYSVKGPMSSQSIRSVIFFL